MDDHDYVPWKEVSNMLNSEGITMAEKYIRFAIDEISFPAKLFKCKTKQNRNFCIIPSIRKHGNRIFVKKDDVRKYIENLKQMRVELTYKDVQEIVKKYQLVLKRPRKRAMRGQRNFTGKIEDEIRGKLGEIGIARFCNSVGGIQFVVDFSTLEKGKLRDEGDFIEVITHGEKHSLSNDLKIAVKSTAGYFAIALPENEWEWPGNIYISVRLHIEESFLFKLINKGLDLENFELNQQIGWLEIFGYITKSEMEQISFQGTRLPGKYHASNEDWSKTNYIMHPMQLYRTRDEFRELMKKYVYK